MRIYLDGLGYELKAGTSVVRTPITEWSDNVRLDGQQKRKDRRLMSTWSIDDWSKGFGLRKITNPDDPNQQGHFWDAENVDTRWSAIMVSQGYQTASISASRADLDIALPYMGELYFIESQKTGSAVAHKFDGSLSIASLSMIQISGGIDAGIGSLRGAYALGNKFVIHGYPTGGAGDGISSLFRSYGTMGGSTVGVTVGTTGGAINFNHFTKFADVGGTIHVIFGNNNQVMFSIINSAVGSLQHVATYPTTLGSYLSPLSSDGVNVYAVLPDGVYDFDETPAKIIDTTTSQDKNALITSFQNFLHLKNRYSLLEYDGANIKSVGYDRGDGLPSDKWGEITAMTSSYQWIFAAVKGATYSHILTKDGNDYWHYFGRVPTAGLWVRDLFLSNSPDGTDRLWAIYGNHGNPGFWLYPYSDPRRERTSAAQTTVPTGYFTTSIFDGGMMEIKTVLTDVNIMFANTSGESNIKVSYFPDFFDTTGFQGSLLGTLGVSAINNTKIGSFIFGSPYGAEVNTVALNFDIKRGAANTQLFNAQVHYLKDPNKRYYYDFVIDVKKSAEANRSLESVYGSLAYMADKKTLSSLYYGLVGTKIVKVLDLPSNEQTIHDDEYLSQREGFLQMRVAEII